MHTSRMPKPSLKKKRAFLTMPMAIVTAFAIVSTSLLAYGQLFPLLTGATLMQQAIPSLFGSTSRSSLGIVTGGNTSFGTTTMTVGAAGLTCEITVADGSVSVKMKRGGGAAILGGSPGITLYSRIIGTPRWESLGTEPGAANAFELIHPPMLGMPGEEYYAECRTSPTDFEFSRVVPLQAAPQYVSFPMPTTSSVAPVRSSASSSPTISSSAPRMGDLTCAISKMQGDFIAVRMVRAGGIPLGGTPRIIISARIIGTTTAWIPVTGNIITEPTRDNAGAIVMIDSFTLGAPGLEYTARCETSATSFMPSGTVSIPIQSSSATSARSSAGTVASSSACPVPPQLYTCYNQIPARLASGAMGIACVPVPIADGGAEDCAMYGLFYRPEECAAANRCDVQVTVNGRAQNLTPR